MHIKKYSRLRRKRRKRESNFYASRAPNMSWEVEREREDKEGEKLREILEIKNA